MKHLFFVVILLSFFRDGFACAESAADSNSGLNAQLSIVVESFSRAYADEYAGLGSKVGAAILTIDDVADEARRNKIGETVTVYLMEALGRSLVLSPIDRKNTETMIREMKLSLSGMVNEESAVEVGNLTGVRAIIWGNVTAIQDRFRVTLNLTDGETGLVLETSSFEIPKRDLIDVSLELQYSYVAKNGIGLSLDTFYPIIKPALFNKSYPGMVDFNANYRAARWLMVSAGIMTFALNTGEHYRWDGDMPYASLQPGLPAEDRTVPWGALPDAPSPMYGISQLTSQFTFMLAHLDVQFTLNIHPKFNVGLSVGPVMFVTNPTMTTTIGSKNSLFYRAQFADPAAGGVVDSGQYYSQPMLDNNPITYIFEMPGGLPGIGGRAEVRPEFFITPRFAVHGTIGYLLMAPLFVREVHASNASWSFYQDQSYATWAANPDFDFAAAGTAKDNAWYNQFSSWVYYGWDPLLMPDGGRWVLNLSCLYFQIGVSFFF